MSAESLASQIRALETQLAVVKAQLAQLSPARPPGTFGDLYGLFAGQSTVTDADLELAKYQFEWDGRAEG